MQDADASDLGRLTLSKPVRAEDIFCALKRQRSFICRMSLNELNGLVD